MVNWGVMDCVFMSIKKGTNNTLDKCNWNHTGVSSPQRDTCLLGLSDRPSQYPCLRYRWKCLFVRVCVSPPCLQAELRAEQLKPLQTARTPFHLFLLVWALWTSHGILSAFRGASVGGLLFSVLFYRMHTLGSKQYANPLSSDSSSLSKAK